MLPNDGVQLILTPVQAGEHTSGGGCGSIGFNAGHLTREDGRMKVRLKVLPNKPRAAAWPSSFDSVPK